MHFISFQFTSSQLTMNSYKPCLFFETSAPAHAGHYLVWYQWYQCNLTYLNADIQLTCSAGIEPEVWTPNSGLGTLSIACREAKLNPQAGRATTKDEKNWKDLWQNDGRSVVRCSKILIIVVVEAVPWIEPLCDHWQERRLHPVQGFPGDQTLACEAGTSRLAFRPGIFRIRNSIRLRLPSSHWIWDKSLVMLIL